jgi:hypothetical protein
MTPSQTRKSVVESHYGYDAAIGRSKIGEWVDKHDAQSGRMGPTNEVRDAIAGSTMPLADIKEAGVRVASESDSDYMRFYGAHELGRNTGGQYDPARKNIRYKAGRLDSMDDKRGALVHESAHSLQNDLGRHEMLENDKSARLGVALDPHSDVSKQLAARYRAGGGLSELESIPIHDMSLPVAEGSAEGYRLLHTNGKGQWAYRPEYFSTHSALGPQLFEQARAETFSSGKVVPDSTAHGAARLAGVLKSDLVDGKRDIATDIGAAQRMLMHAISHPDPVTGEHPHRDEWRTRMKAIDGERVQLSMFPDLVPETDQFGGTPTGTPERSPRGEALAAGINSEKSYKDTIIWREHQADILRTERRNNRPVTDWGVSPLHGRLVKAHIDKLNRDQQASTAQERAVSGELHPVVHEWLGKLVHKEKKVYAEAYARHRAGMGPAPELPKGLKEEHAEKARNSVDKLWDKHNL